MSAEPTRPAPSADTASPGGPERLPAGAPPAPAGAARPGPLAGIRIVDLSRLAPGPYASMLLADLGAEVIAVAGGRAGPAMAEFGRGKRTVVLDLKSAPGRAAFHRLVETADVVIEGFRPGVAAGIGADHATLDAINPRIVHCSLTGWGPSGPLAQSAGHDINYLSISGLLGSLGPAGGPPLPPLNVAADLAGGSMVAVIGILAALVERDRSGVGQHVDVAMIDGVLSMMAMWFPSWGTPTMLRQGVGFSTGSAPFYRCYRCADGLDLAVGAIEPAFFRALWDGLGTAGPMPDHLEPSGWDTLSARLEARFAERSREEWLAVFEGTDACVTPVLTPAEVWAHPQIASRHPGHGPSQVPAIPSLSRTPSRPGPPDAGDQTASVLRELGMSESEIADVVAATSRSSRPAQVWPGAPAH